MSSLGNWLMYAVHGEVKHPRRSPRRRRGGGVARNWKYRAWIRSLPCLVCGCERSEAAHTGSDGGMRLKASDYSCVPLCSEHHTLGQYSYHRLGREVFAAQFELNLTVMVRFLNLQFREGQ